MVVIVHNCWLLCLPYLTWFYFDWRTPKKGGRRSNWIRSWTLWRHFKDYFSIHLIKTHNLVPSHSYIFGARPHGIFGIGSFGNFCSDYSDFKKLFPGLTSHLHKSLSYMLSKEGGGNVSVIILGGTKESLDAHLGKFTVFIRQRKGFVKLALTHGAYLVPVFSFGENDLYKQIQNPEGSWLRTVQDGLQQIVTLALSLFHGRGIFQYSFGLMPHRKPIHSVVGCPIPVQQTLHPTQQTEELLTYREELRKLFEEHKGKYGIAGYLHTCGPWTPVDPAHLCTQDTSTPEPKQHLTSVVASELKDKECEEELKKKRREDMRGEGRMGPRPGLQGVFYQEMQNMRAFVDHDVQGPVLVNMLPGPFSQTVVLFWSFSSED
ncbi:LOW QUALITY PROTEIN: 2-acylglycerol O-acyltransferase 1 [Erethizon dorsatum]